MSADNKPRQSVHRSVPERVLTKVTPPRSKPLASNEFWKDKEKTKPNLKEIKTHLFEEGRILREDFFRLLKLVTEQFKKEENVLTIDAPITICGDIHGQYYDLMKLFEVGGDPKDTQYLFLGDYVDRGLFSVECVILLYAYKLNDPGRFFMLRGNHECRHLTEYFTFKEETNYKYSQDVYEQLMVSFDALPLAALVNQEFLCIHGGISPSIRTIKDIDKVNRFQEPPQMGVMCDLLWADPMEDYDTNPHRSEGFTYNDVRSCSFQYGYNAVTAFLKRNDLRCIIRAHEAQNEGYRMYKAYDGFPTVITLFSAPNYLDTYGNKGAIMHFDGQVMNIRQFEWSEHPYWLPHFMNVFTWSIPFVAEKTVHMVQRILEIIDAEEEADLERQEKLAQSEPVKAAAKRREVLRRKILTVGRMRARLKDLREERVKLLHSGSDGFTSVPDKEVQNFSKVKQRDKKNEARPPSPSHPSLSDDDADDISSTTTTTTTSSSSSSKPSGKPRNPPATQKKSHSTQQQPSHSVDRLKTSRREPQTKAGSDASNSHTKLPPIPLGGGAADSKPRPPPLPVLGAKNSSTSTNKNKGHHSPLPRPGGRGDSSRRFQRAASLTEDSKYSPY